MIRMRKATWPEWFEVAFGVLDALLRLGLLTGSGIAAAFGQFLLAAVLLALAFGLFLRVWRRRRIQRARQSGLTT